MRSSFFFLVARDKRAGGATSRIFIIQRKRLCGLLSSTGVPAPEPLGELARGPPPYPSLGVYGKRPVSGYSRNVRRSWGEDAKPDSMIVG
jgi:hypothetical protein